MPKTKEKTVVFEPIGDRMVVRRDDSEETTEGGIVLPGVAQEKARFGTVVACGPKVEQCEKGDRVILGLYTEEAEVAGQAFVLVCEKDIQAIVREE